MLRSAVVAWVLFALAASIPSSAVLGVAVRAASAERARAREEQEAARADAAREAARDVETAVTRAKDTLRAVGVDATSARLAEVLAAARAPFADVVVADAAGALLVPPSPSPEPPDSASCLAARDRLAGEARAEARAHLLAECEGVRAASGRHLWPLLALEEPGTAAGVAAWIEQNVERLAPAEREVLRARVEGLAAPDRARALAALDRAPSLHGTLTPLLAESSPDDAVDGAVRVHRGHAISVLRTMPSGLRAGYVVHAVSLARGLAIPGDLAAVVTPSAGPLPAGAVRLAPDLVLDVAPRDPRAAATAARRSGDRIVAAAVAAVAVSVLLAALLFARARRAQRLAELRTDFVAAVSHELRTPVASMRILAELLERGAVPADERAEVEGTLAGEVRRLGGTLERMLRFGALARGKLAVDRAPARLAPILEGAADRASASRDGAPRRVELDVDPALEADVDEALLGLAVDNLLSNAAKYAPDGAPYELSARRDGADVAIALTDHGPGLDRRAQARVFLPFERADDRLSRATEGTGVGLALVRGIARAHGGDASVRSAPGEGATFVIRFPARRA